MRISAIIPVTLLALSVCSCTPRGYVALNGYAQGGVYCVKYNPEAVTLSPSQVHAAVDSILTDVDFSLSGYNKASSLSRLNAGDTIEPGPTFRDMYRMAYEASELTGGIVDASSAPLFDMWGFGFTLDSLPSPEAVDSALLQCGFARLKSPDDFAALYEGRPVCARDFLKDTSLLAPKLNFNAIAQGYTSDKIAEYLHSIGVKDMLVDIGEIFCEGWNPSGVGWSVGVDNPVDGNESPGTDMRAIWQSDGTSCGVVTSGNYRKFYIKDGKKYAHTIDPRTGYPVTHGLLSATVVAPTAFEADMYATFFMVIGPEEAVDFVKSHDDIECFLITSDGTWASEGFTLKK